MSTSKKIGVLAVAAAISLAALAFLVGTRSGEKAATPEENASTDIRIAATQGAVPKVDYTINLDTGVMTPLPEAFLRSVAKPGASGLSPRYAASPDGTQLAYVGIGDEGSLQIFTAGIDGTEIRQATHDPMHATFPAWSPDGSVIAYRGSEGVLVLDVATGESTPIADETSVHPWASPSFTPDGLSLVFNGGSNSLPVLRIVPIAGGESTILFGRGRGGMDDAANGSVSPDGSLVTMMGSEIGGPGALRFVANADGTERRQIAGRASNSAGTWSPDGSRIVCSESDGSGGIIVVDIATGDVSQVSEGRAAIWLDRRTLLVEV